MGFGTDSLTSPRWCFLTEDCIEYTNNCYHDIDGEKPIPDWFFYLIVMITKFIESLQITCVLIKSYIKSHYHANIVEMCLLNINIVIIRTLLEIMIVM